MKIPQKYRLKSAKRDLDKFWAKKNNPKLLGRIYFSVLPWDAKLIPFKPVSLPCFYIHVCEIIVLKPLRANWE